MSLSYQRMRFADILKEAFALSWRYKWFWLAGFVIYPQLVGGYPFDFQYQPGDEFPMRLFLIIVAAGMLLAVLTLLAGAFLQPALILATSNARAGTPIRAGEALRSGFDYFGRCLGLALLWFGCGILLFIMLGIPLIIAFINSVVLGVVVAFFFIPVALAVATLLTAIMNYAYRNIVLLNMNIGDSISRAFQQLTTAKMAAVGLTFTALLIPIIALTPISLIFTMSQVAVQVAFNDSSLVLGAIYFFAAVLSIPLAGYFGAFSNVLFTIAHYEWFLRERSDSDVPKF